MDIHTCILWKHGLGENLAEPKLAWSDLEHLTGRGLNLIGHTLADAIEAAYTDWKKQNPALVGSPALAQAGD